MACSTPVKSINIAADSHCALAKRVPTPSKTGNDAIDRAKKDEYDDLVEIIDILTACPELRAGAARYLRTARKETEEKKSEGNLETFDKLGANFGQFVKNNEAWCVTWLNKVLTGVSTADQAKAREHDKDVVKQQMCFLLNVTTSWQLLVECKFVKVANAMFAQRLAECGKRQDLLLGALEKFVMKSGQLAWNLGVYTVKLDPEGKIIAVVHRPTKDEAAVDKADGLDKGWGISNNYSDFGAAFVKGRHQQLMVFKFFDKRSGPYKVAQWSGKLKESDAAHAQRLLVSAQSNAVAMDMKVIEETKSVLDAPLALKRKEAASRARACLDGNQASLKRIRVVQVGVEAVEAVPLADQ